MQIQTPSCHHGSQIPPSDGAQAAAPPPHHGELDALARIEGQVRGIQRMIHDGRYCMDILTQTRAIHAALRRVERHVLQAHLQTCVHESFHHGSADDREQKISEILSFFDWEPGRSAR